MLLIYSCWWKAAATLLSLDISRDISVHWYESGNTIVQPFTVRRIILVSAFMNRVKIS